MQAYTQNMPMDATYWPRVGGDGFGRGTYGAALPIKCRWEDKATMFRDAQGNEVVSSSIVYVDRDLEIGGMLAFGNHVGTPDAAAKEIRQLLKSPSLDASKTLHKAML